MNLWELEYQPSPPDGGQLADRCGRLAQKEEELECRMRDTAEYRDEVCRDLAEQTRRYGYLDAHCIRALYEGFNEKIMELNREKMRLAAQRIKLCEASSRSAAGQPAFMPRLANTAGAEDSFGE